MLAYMYIYNKKNIITQCLENVFNSLLKMLERRASCTIRA